MVSSETNRRAIADWPAKFSRRSAFAWSLSAAVHVTLIVAASGVPLVMPEAEHSAPGRIIWMNEWPPPEISPPEPNATPPPEPDTTPPELPPEAPSSDAPPGAPDPAPAAPEQPQPPTIADERRRVEDDPQQSSQQQNEPTTAVTPDESTPLPSGVDWEAARDRAIDRVLEQQRREQAYMTFSVDDLIDEPPPEEPLPDTSIFDAPSRPPSLLSPGRARTSAGRWLGDVCNSLTGGIGVFGLFSLCANEEERIGYFSRLKPAYLTSRPVCEEVARPPVGGSAATTTQKCRLVPVSE